MGVRGGAWGAQEALCDTVSLRHPRTFRSRFPTHGTRLSGVQETAHAAAGALENNPVKLHVVRWIKIIRVTFLNLLAGTLTSA